MYRWHDILIIGDSFCAQRITNDHWPKLLATELSNDLHEIPRGKGYSGCSWWSTRNDLLSEFEIRIPKLLIIIHTEYSRLPSDLNLPLNMRTIDFFLNKNKNQHIDNQYSAGKLYYEHLYSRNFHKWAYENWFNELENILDKYKIEKIIHLFSFLNGRNSLKESYKFRNGLSISEPLEYYSAKNYCNIKTEYLPNHFTYENNHKLAFSLKNIILNDYSNGEIYKKSLII